MADSSRHNMYLVAEATYGSTPSTPALTKLRHKGTTLGMTKSSIISEEIRADRQVQDFRHGTKQTGGDISTELCYGAHDALLEAVLCGTWTPPYTAATISAAASDNSLNDTASGFPWLVAGDKIAVTGFTGVGTTANTTLTVVSRTASKIVVSGATLVDDAAGESVTITTLTAHLKAGTTRRSFSMLRNFSDLEAGSDPYHLFTGVELTKFDLKVAPGAIIEASYAVVGKGLALADTAPAGATYPAANTNSPMDAFGGTLEIDDVANSLITEITLTLENGIEPRFVVGSAETIRPSIGRSNLTGQVTAYFEDSDMVNRFLDETETKLEFTLGDGTNEYKVELPRIKFTGGQPDVKGTGPITLAMPFQALYDPVVGSQIVITRIPA